MADAEKVNDPFAEGATTTAPPAAAPAAAEPAAAEPAPEAAPEAAAAAAPAAAAAAPAPTSAEPTDETIGQENSIAGLLFTFLSGLALIFVVIGTPIAWFEKKVSGGDADFVTLWKFETAAGATTYVKDIGCSDLKQHLRGAEAFSIISIGAMLLCVAAGALLHKGGSELFAYVAGFIAMIATLITWAIGIRVYYRSFCDQTALYDDGYVVAGGPGLFVVAWIITIVSMIIVKANPVAPKGERATKLGDYVFALFSMAAFVFAIVGTGVQWFYIRNVGGYDKSFGIWRLSTGGDGKFMSVQDITGCDDVKQYFQAAEAFSVCSIVFTFASMLVSFAIAAQGRNRLRKVSVALGWASTALLLITWATVARIYWVSWCNGAFNPESEGYNVGAGMALYVSAFAFMLVGSLLLSISASIGKQKSDEPVKFPRLLFTFGIAIALLFCVIGAALTQIHNETTESGDPVTYDITLWHVQRISNGAVKTDEHFSLWYLDCASFVRRFRAAAAFDIIACVLLFVALVLGVALNALPTLKMPAVGLALSGSVAALISWAIVVSTYHRTNCGSVNFANIGADLASGAGLIIAGWVVSLLVSIVLVIIG